MRPPLRSTTATAWLAATAATALLVTGCGSSDDGKPVARKSAAPAGSRQINAHPLSDIKQGGTLKLPISQWIADFNRYTANGNQGDAASINELVEPDLFDADAQGDSHINKNFLVSAEVTSTSPQTVVYKLNPKARWSDGKSLSWRDFKAVWQAQNGRNKAYEAADTSGYEQITTVEQGADAHQVKVVFAGQYADWQRLFDPLLPAAAIDTPEKFNKGWTEKIPVTGNAFRISSYDRTAQTITAVPDPNWWGTRPKLDSIVFRALDYTAWTDAYLNKEIDYASAILPEDYKRLNKAAGTDIRVGARWDEVHIELNGAHGPLKDVRVRQALQHAIDRKAIATAFGKDLPVELKTYGNHFFMPNQAGYQDNSGGYATYDLKKAGELLDAAGWKLQGDKRVKDGRQLTLGYTLSAGSTSAQVDQSELVQAQLAQAGIKVDIQKVPSDDYFSKYVTIGNFDLTSFRWVDQTFRSQAYPIYREPSGKNLYENYGSVGSPEIDALLTKAGETTDTTAANKLYNEADAKIWALGHSIPLYQRPQVLAVRSDLANFGATGLASDDYTKVGWLK
ncbi:ABC transporter family substrate-binding protein [Streptomyces hyaluromycini]|uniref:ABC transporter family substrate-binding protein n=1 Tax=Streptomyces hyaluromycini TaxID=1377993 RepID=A0ABV1X8V2_9ACTN